MHQHNLTNSDDTSKAILVNGSATGTVTSGTASAIATDCASATDDSAAGSASATITSIKSKINSGTRYVISFGYSTTGMIKRINITLPTNN